MKNNSINSTNKAKKINATPLLFAVFIIAICGIIYELIIGAISSYLLGDSVKQYSITIGLFMSAMGIGSYLTKRFKHNLFDTFVMIELLIGLVGGISAVFLFASYGYSNTYYLVMYGTIIVIGILVGLEIPILTRIIEENEHNLRITIANVLSFDYIGALIGSIAFPLILLPHLGHIKTSFFVGFINIMVANVIIFKYANYIKYIKQLKLIAFLITCLILAGFFTADQTANRIENNLYRDQIIYKKQTVYQKMVVTKHRDDMRLFLNGNIQFSSRDEYRYHEALVHPAMSLAKNRDNILILGGGDGLAAREIFKYDDVRKVTLVDLDPEVIRFCRTNPLVSALNKGSLDNDKMTIINQDAYKFLEETDGQYDVIIIDLPDPNNESLNKLYTNLFYRLVYSRLSRNGMISIQSTSPYYAKDAYWSIVKTVESENFSVASYHTFVPSFGDWGFTLASKAPFNEADIRITVPTKYLDNTMVHSLFDFGMDEKDTKNAVKINRLTNPVLIDYYQKAWNSY